MKKLFCCLFLVLCVSLSYSQSLKKYAISNSGCSVYSFCDPGTFDMTYSEDSAKVFTSECKGEEAYYGIICIELKEPINDLSIAEEVLVSYLNYLKSAFKIKTAAGYGKGHKLRDKENTRGVLDYWNDEEKNNWKVKGWTDGNFITVLYAYSQKDLPETKVNAFLDGLLFKGM
ncbi:MAG: hypothetical protein IPL84_02105 [Chitinophagaceae bacterium]|nr:hypothetical protein [Chitinophagaceae bacterium]